MMKRVCQIFAFSLLLTVTGAAQGIALGGDWQKQEKPPERPKERPKEDKRPDPPKEDKKKPYEG